VPPSRQVLLRDSEGVQTPVGPHEERAVAESARGKHVGEVPRVPVQHLQGLLLLHVVQGCGQGARVVVRDPFAEHRSQFVVTDEVHVCLSAAV